MTDIDRVFQYTEITPTALAKTYSRLIVFNDGVHWCVYPHSNTAKSHSAYRKILKTGETRFERVPAATWCLEHADETVRLYPEDL